MASKERNASVFPTNLNSGNVYRLAENFSSVLLGVDILLQLW